MQRTRDDRRREAVDLDVRHERREQHPEERQREEDGGGRQQQVPGVEREPAALARRWQRRLVDAVLEREPARRVAAGDGHTLRARHRRWRSWSPTMAMRTTATT